MNVLLVSPAFPMTYWGMQHAVAAIGKRATLPPLGLITVAALLPPQWRYRLVDVNVEPLTDEAIDWADAVLVGGMHIQEPSIHEIVARAKAQGRTTVVGGPGPTTASERYEDADVVVLGELEGLVDQVVDAIVSPRTGTVIDASETRPELSDVPVPRYDLLQRAQYTTMSLQYSRGCPFQCEFCDIIEIFGRRPRVKSDAQVLAELDALVAAGHKGSVFFVDDNFIGNKPAVKRLLPSVRRWQADHGYPFDLFTEASVNLADDVPLMEGMVDAGFSSVFLGIESPSPEALRSANKAQNLRRPLAESVEIVTRQGLEVMGGFIVGFDEDGPDVFEAQRQFIQSSPIPMAMVGLLMALPGTALARRLAREGRLRSPAGGDQFERPNFETRMDEAELLRGYAKLMAELYAPDAYYARCMQFLERAPEPRLDRRTEPEQIATLLRTFLRIGVRSPRRGYYWALLARALTRAPGNFARAIAHAVQGEHLIRYTSEVLLPRLEAAIAEIERGVVPPPLAPDLAAQQGADTETTRLVQLRVPAPAPA